jgi:hypothetical protein
MSCHLQVTVWGMMSLGNRRPLRKEGWLLVFWDVPRETQTSAVRREGSTWTPKDAGW